MNFRRLLYTAGVLLGLTAFGVVGYRVIEGSSWDDALFMTVITLSTVGYSEAIALSPAGRMFTILLIVAGIGIVFGVTGMWVRVLLEGELEQALGRRRNQRLLRMKKGHCIVCGYGRFGHRVVRELVERGEDVVVVDEALEPEEGLAAVRGDATEEDVLREAGVDHAKVLIAALPSDAENVFITLTAKELRPEIFIVARCEQASSEPRLRRAGASRVVAPYAISAHRMVGLALNPAVVEFGDLIAGADHESMSVAEVFISAGSSVDGRTLGETRITRRLGLLPVGVIAADGEVQVGVGTDRVLCGGEVLLVFGSQGSVEKLAEECGAGSGGTEVD